MHCATTANVCDRASNEIASERLGSSVELVNTRLQWRLVIPLKSVTHGSIMPADTTADIIGMCVDGLRSIL